MDNRMLGWRRVTLSMIKSRQPRAKMTSGSPLPKQAGKTLHHHQGTIQEAATANKNSIRRHPGHVY